MTIRVEIAINRTRSVELAGQATIEIWQKQDGDWVQQSETDVVPHEDTRLVILLEEDQRILISGASGPEYVLDPIQNALLPQGPSE